MACLAQEQTATLKGTVTDPFGSPIKNVRAQLESEDRNSPPISVKADDSGRFRFTNLPPATYRLGIYSPAFKTAFRSEIRLLAGQRFSIPSIVLDLDVFSCGDPTIDAVQHLAPGDDSGTLRGSVLDRVRFARRRGHRIRELRGVRHQNTSRRRVHILQSKARKLRCSYFEDRVLPRILATLRRVQEP